MPASPVPLAAPRDDAEQSAAVANGVAALVAGAGRAHAARHARLRVLPRRAASRQGRVHRRAAAAAHVRGVHGAAQRQSERQAARRCAASMARSASATVQRVAFAMSPPPQHQRTSTAVLNPKAGPRRSQSVFQVAAQTAVATGSGRGLLPVRPARTALRTASPDTT
jgi:hypothetical protein